MDREQLTRASERIERAFARLDEVACRPVVSAPASALVHQNMQLRETMDEALGELDLLIERLGG